MPTDDRDKLEAQISAYLDGELDEAERADLELRLERDPQARAMLESLRRTVQLVQGLPRSSAPDSLIDDLTARIEREHLLGEIPSRREVHRPRRTVWPLVASAAVVVFAVGAGFWVMRDLIPERGGSRTLTFAPQDADRYQEGGRAPGGGSAAPTAVSKEPSEDRLKKAEPAPVPAGGGDRPALLAKPEAAAKDRAAAITREEAQVKSFEQSGFDKRVLANEHAQPPVSAEPLLLNVSVETDSEKARLEEKLFAYFAANEIEPIAPEGTVLGRSLARKAETSSAPGDELAGPVLQEEPLIVELPSHQVDGLVDRLAESPHGRRGIELQVGDQVIASDEREVRRALVSQRGMQRSSDATSRPDSVLADAPRREFGPLTRAAGHVTSGEAGSSTMPAGIAEGELLRRDTGRPFDEEDDKAIVPSAAAYAERAAAATSPAAQPEDLVRLEINFRAAPARGLQASQPASARPATSQPTKPPIQPRSPHRIWRRRAP